MAASEFNILQKSLEDARKNLSYTDGRIEKVTGRKPAEMRMMNRGRLFSAGTGPPDMFRQRTRSWNTSQGENTMPLAKRRDTSGPGGRFDRVGKKEGSSSEDEEKPSLLSVVAGGTKGVTRTNRSHSDLVDRSDGKSNRNKRMLGVLMGTLNRFKSDQQKESQTGKDKKRQEIENRVEDERQAVREEMAAKRKELFAQRKTQHREVLELERKMQIVETFKEWEEHYLLLGKFLKTQTKPHIYYMPKTHTKKTQDLLEKNAEECKGHVANLQAKMKDDLEGNVIPTDTQPGTSTDAMDDNSLSKDQDLGELEGQPAELNITAQHEERQEREGVDKMESGNWLGSVGDVVVKREVESGENKVSDEGSKMDSTSKLGQEQESQVHIKRDSRSSTGSSN